MVWNLVVPQSLEELGCGAGWGSLDTMRRHMGQDSMADGWRMEVKGIITGQPETKLKTES